jgi:hypothetical protein
MPETTQIVQWIRTGEIRLVVAAALFLLMWAIKAIPWVRLKLLTTPRHKQVASWFLLLPPAVWMIVNGAPWVEIVASAVGIILAANGINTYRPSKAKKP